MPVQLCKAMQRAGVLKRDEWLRAPEKKVRRGHCEVDARADMMIGAGFPRTATSRSRKRPRSRATESTSPICAAKAAGGNLSIGQVDKGSARQDVDQSHDQQRRQKRGIVRVDSTSPATLLTSTIRRKRRTNHHAQRSARRAALSQVSARQRDKVGPSAH